MTTPQEPLYRLIPLTQGQHAMVDASDYDWLTQWEWHAVWRPKGKCFYAVRNGLRIGPRSLNKRLPEIPMHRQILGLERGDKRKGDHINRNTLDNRRINLRIATHMENTYNSKIRTTNKSGFKGVSLHRMTGKWQASLRANGVQTYLGLYSTREEAFAVVEAERNKRHGEFARSM